MTKQLTVSPLDSYEAGVYWIFFAGILIMTGAIARISYVLYRRQKNTAEIPKIEPLQRKQLFILSGTLQVSLLSVLLIVMGIFDLWYLIEAAQYNPRGFIWVGILFVGVVNVLTGTILMLVAHQDSVRPWWRSLMEYPYPNRLRASWRFLLLCAMLFSFFRAGANTLLFLCVLLIVFVSGLSSTMVSLPTARNDRDYAVVRKTRLALSIVGGLLELLLPLVFFASYVIGGLALGFFSGESRETMSREYGPGLSRGPGLLLPGVIVFMLCAIMGPKLWLLVPEKVNSDLLERFKIILNRKGVDHLLVKPGDEDQVIIDKTEKSR